ncbi:MAG: sulfur carrier protein ThiS [Hyphomonadaceae bacterium]|jgi:thiamine biosynthesis protein ThiS|nr:sulfur carrier protein ThiS [Hyphomonadaceae bacterium]
MTQTFTFNGEPRDISSDLTVTGLVASLDLDPRGVAIERNRMIVPKSAWDTTLLAPGDVVELVQFVGGGL